MVKKNKEEYSNIMVSNVKSSPKDAYFNYKSVNKGLD